VNRESIKKKVMNHNYINKIEKLNFDVIIYSSNFNILFKLTKYYYYYYYYIGKVKSRLYFYLSSVKNDRKLSKVKY
jgi:hypothetical protein